MSPAAPPPILPRHAAAAVERAFAAGRIVLISGPRQSGKTTLAQAVCRERDGDFVTLDEDPALRSVLADPAAFLDRDRLLAIDEFQKAGEPLLRALKLAVDRDRRKGRYLLTGSTRFLTVPRVSESLAGRVVIVDLWPFTQGEIRGRRDDFAADLFGETTHLRRKRPERLERPAALQVVCRGGFPEVHAEDEPVRRAWFASYVRTLTQRDALEISRISRAGALPRVLRALGARTAQELNVSATARDLGLPRTTVEDYGLLLENLHLWFRLPAWSRNLTSRAVRHPKAYVADPGLAAWLIGASPASIAPPGDPVLGALLETFVAGEILRQRTWSTVGHEAFHFRDAKGAEVDLVLEAPDGRIAAMEVKASSTIDDRDLRTMERMRDRLGGRFAHGALVYLGGETLSLGERLTAVPLPALWGGRPGRRGRAPPRAPPPGDPSPRDPTRPAVRPAPRPAGPRPPWPLGTPDVRSAHGRTRPGEAGRRRGGAGRGPGRDAARARLGLDRPPLRAGGRRTGPRRPPGRRRPDLPGHRAGRPRGGDPARRPLARGAARPHRGRRRRGGRPPPADQGRGGALLHEKIVAAASARLLIVVDARKVVERLGAFPLPVEVIPFAEQVVAARIRAMGVEPRLRRGASGEPFATDEGNRILDCPFGRIDDPEALAARLSAVPGVVEHGLFLGLAHEVIVARGGTVLRMRR